MRDFLEWLTDGEAYRGSYLELRTLGDLGYRKQRWFGIPNQLTELMTVAISDDAEGHEVYVGVVPRVRRGGSTEDTHQYVHILWADVDAKDHDGSKRKALDAILGFDVPPSVIVDSGGGFHAYWSLRGYHLFDVVQPIMKGIAQRIGGDRVYDRARILRLPGLSNHKGGGSAPVRLIRFDTTLTYSLSDLAEYAWREPRTYQQYFPEGAYSVLRGGDAIPQSALGWANYGSGNLAVLDLDFDPGKGARSEHDFAVACSLIEAGYGDDAIVQTFLSHPNGVGAKVASKGQSGIRYLERTIRKAHQAVGR